MQHNQLHADPVAGMFPPHAAGGFAPEAMPRKDERLARPPPDGYVATPLSPEKMAAIDAQTTKEMRHSTRRRPT